MTVFWVVLLKSSWLEKKAIILSYISIMKRKKHLLTQLRTNRMKRELKSQIKSATKSLAEIQEIINNFAQRIAINHLHSKSLINLHLELFNRSKLSRHRTWNLVHLLNKKWIIANIKMNSHRLSVTMTISNLEIQLMDVSLLWEIRRANAMTILEVPSMS